MKLSEYMKTYKRSVLGKLEMQAFGIPDLKKGWPKRYADLEISQDMLNVILKIPKVSESNRKLKKKILKQITKTIKYEVTDEKLLYLMRNANGLLKIGISVDPVKRARQLSTGSGVNVVCIAAWKLDKNSRMVEGQLHKRFGKDRLEGEWFSPDSVTVKSVQENISCNYELVHSEDFKEVEKYFPTYDEYKFNRIKYRTEKAILFDFGDWESWCPKSRIFHLNESENFVKVQKGQFSPQE